MAFKLWSELNKEALEILKPNFGFRSWNILTESEKSKIWKYLQGKYFFNPIPKRSLPNGFTYNDNLDFEFDESYIDRNAKEQLIASIISELNNSYKAKSFGKNFFEDETFFNACVDYHSIFIKENEAVVIEMLSLYAKYLIGDEVNKQDQEATWTYFDAFAEDINEIFSHFGLNLYLSCLGFMPKQEDKILITSIQLSHLLLKFAQFSFKIGNFSLLVFLLVLF